VHYLEERLEESKPVGDRVRASLSWGFTLAHTQPAACDSAAPRITVCTVISFFEKAK